MFADGHNQLGTFSDEEIDGILYRAKAAGLEFMVISGLDLKSSEKTLMMGQRDKALWPQIGIYGWWALELDASTYPKLKDLAKRDEVVAIGEIGLDYTVDPDRETQKRCFAEQVKLAKELGLPLSLYTNTQEGYQDVVNILYKEKTEGLGAVFNTFDRFMLNSQRDYKPVLKNWLDMGYYVSFSPGLLHSEEPALMQQVKEIPLDRLIIESEAYNDPVASERYAEPAEVVAVAERVAQIKGTTPEEIGRVTIENIKQLYRKTR